MNGFQVKQHLDLILTWTSTKASITAWKNKKKKKKKKISHMVSSRWMNVCVDKTKLSLCFTSPPYEWGLFH